MSHDKVSVVIPLYNAAPWIEATLQSCFGQSYENVGVVVVDDGSSDGSFEIAKRFESSRCVVVRQPNSGPGAARNTALQIADGTYIQFLDADDLLAPNKITRQLALCKNLGDQAFVFGGLHPFDADVRNAAHIDRAYHRTYDDVWRFLVDYWQIGGLFQVGTALIPRALVDAAGAWDETLMLNEDGDFVSRVVAASRRVVYDPNPSLYYRVGNAASLSATRSWRHYDSQIRSYESYARIAASSPSKPALEYAIAAIYTPLRLATYPDFPDLDERIVAALARLGHPDGVAAGPRSFQMAFRVLGLRRALRIRHFFRTARDRVRRP